MKASISERREVAERLYASIGEGLLGLYSAVLGDDAKNRTAVLYKRLAYLIDPGEDVSMSAYDLLSEEDREILRWVRSVGGLDAVSARYREADYRRIELCSTLGIDTETGWSDAMAETLRRLMPEGYEWPRFDGGEQVEIGDETDRLRVDEVRFGIRRGGGCTLLQVAPDGITERLQELSPGERVKRPAVLAADGEPLEAGQTVWNMAGTEFEVLRIRHDMPPVELKGGDERLHYEFSSRLTHRRLVLDADGVPIRVGDEMYGTVEGGPFIVTEVSDKGSVFVDAFPDTGMHGSMLTHTKSESPDSWETIEEESQLYRCEYFDHMGGSCHDCPGGPSGSCQANMMVDIVKRCKNLAEKSES